MNKTKVLVCLLLILPLAGPGRKPSRRTGLETPERTALLNELRRCSEVFRAARVEQALVCFEAGRERAMALNQRDLASRFLCNSASCFLARRQYQPALEHFLRARHLAESARDSGAAGIVDANISSLYEQMGETTAAARWAELALRRIESKHLPKVLIQLASLRSRQGRAADALPLFRQGIQQADAAGDAALYALGCDRMGEELYKTGRLDEAEEAMLAAYRVRKLQRLPALETSYRNLGRLHLARGDLRAAAKLLDRAVQARPTGFMPMWDLYHTRGRVRLATGQLPEALADFRAAIDLVRQWRAGIAGGDATRLSSEQLLQQAYSGQARAAALLFLKTGRPSLARESFEAAEENRAASLRSLLAAPAVPHLVDRLRPALGADRSYIAFHLDEPDSWRWVVHRDGLSLARLPGRAAMAAMIARFRQDLDGEDLYRALFADIGGPARRSPQWVLALDDELFAAPLSALVESRRDGTPVRLVERHAVQIASAATLLAAAAPADWAAPLRGGFVGLGDPVYNPADERWKGPRPGRRRDPHVALAESGPGFLPRLVGSGHEVEFCAAEWSPSPGLLLRGPRASRRDLRAALETRPAVLHLAAHVLPATESPAGALLALSLAPPGRVETLAPAEIQTWAAHAGTVSLSGCSSGIAAALPGSGLLGLTRAWLAAGAASVVASLWPTPDDTGALFRCFYRHLRQHPGAGPALALRRAQLDMLASPGRRSDPRYWGAYFIVANR